MKKSKKIKMIGNIAKTELQTLFYSPIAWLVLIIIAAQAGMAFTGMFKGLAVSQALNNASSPDLSMRLFGEYGLFGSIQQNLFIYIPLLTMGLISRELSSGSIKLLYSAPVTNTQIVLGKFLSMMIFNLLIVVLLSLYVLVGYLYIENFEGGAVLVGLLGIYLLACTYAAVGILMSGISSYQIVAVICSILLLGSLQAAGILWQDVPFVRDITYWLSMSSRTSGMFSGLICSTDILYFFIVSALFLSLTIMRLRVIRQKIAWSVAWSKYIGIFTCAVLLGYLSNRPMMKIFHDTTNTQRHTLTPASQKIMSQLKGGLTITSYMNILDKHYHMTVPNFINFDKNRLRFYTRFKPEINFKYVYYYDKVDNPGLEARYPNLSDHDRMVKFARYCRLDTSMFLAPAEIRKIIDLSGEKNQFVRVLERSNGEKTFLRMFDDVHGLATEAEISAALQRMVMKVPTVGYLNDHGTRDCHDLRERGYHRLFIDKWNRYGLINNGFNVVEMNLRQPVPEDIDILVIADLKNMLPEAEFQHLEAYVARGGNLVIAGDIRRQEAMNPLLTLFQVELISGQLVKPSAYILPDQIISTITQEAIELVPGFSFPGMGVRMKGCCGLKYAETSGFKTSPVTVCDSSWNELETTNFIDDTTRLNPSAGEIRQTYATTLALSREINGKEQKILITGDADCMNNEESSLFNPYSPIQNINFAKGIFSWLSDGQAPLNMRRPPYRDSKIDIGVDGAEFLSTLFKFILPGILALLGLFIWFRRRGK